MDAAAPPPRIVQFGFVDFQVDIEKKKRKAACKECGAKITDTTTTTSNFIRHYKTHKKRYVIL